MHSFVKRFAILSSVTLFSALLCAQSAPVITSLTPPTGTHGTVVTIAGNNFGATKGTSTVNFNTTLATDFTSWSNTSIVVTDPAGSLDGYVTVTVNGVTSNGIWFPAPNITSVSPNSGSVGTSVTVTGTNFRSTPGTITFNGTAGSPTQWGNTILVPVPAGATTGPVVVTTYNGIVSNGVTFTLTPNITSLSQTSGVVGSSVTITGTNFSTSGTVTFNGTTASTTSWNNTSIAATVPNGATTGNVVVSVNGVASNGVGFTVLPIISNSMCGVAGGGSDATAALPLAYICSSEADTPHSGAPPIPVGTGSLQTAYANANCGDDLQLTAGLNYTITSLQAKNCADSQWIWIRTAPSGNLPPQGTTMTPCYANVTSLADYPAYPCPTSGAFTAKITVAAGTVISGSPDHIRFENLEVAKGAGAASYELFNIVGNKIVFDRLWLHGNPGEELSNAIFADGMSNVSLVDSVATDIHCISVTGIGCEGHVFSTTTSAGPFKISHNYLSAGGQFVLFGGGGFASGTPTSIEISYNRGFRPFTWDQACTAGAGCPGGVLYNGGVGGHAYTVKNCIEFKNAQNVLVFANEWDNVWGGFSQNGNCVTITPKNQAQGSSNLCPQCVTENITERYDFMHYSAQPGSIANVANGNGAYATAGFNYSIHDVLADHTQYPGCYGCTAYMIELASVQIPLSGVSFNHVTIVQDNFTGTDLMEAGGPSTAPLQGSLVLKNSILPAGNYGIGNAGIGNCNTSPAASTPKLVACWTPLTFTNNGIPWGSGTSCNGHGCGGTWNYSGWPGIQILAADQNAVHYTDLVNGNYQLQFTSPFHNQADDGTDLGPDIPTLNTYLANVPNL